MTAGRGMPVIDAKNIETRKADLATLMGEQLRVGGVTLEQKLRRAGRLLPRWARRDAQRFVQASQLAAHPKLSRQIDSKALDTAQARLTRYLTALDPDERRTTARLRLAGEIVLKLLIIAATFVMVMRWQGLV